MTRPLFLALTAFALFGCASAPQQARVDASPAAAPPTAVAEDGTALPNTARSEGAAEANTGAGDAIPNVQLSSALMYQLMAAEVAVQRGELGSAFAVYMKLARETRDPRLARRAAELALQARAMAQGLEAAQLWHELAPNSTEASQTLAMLYTGAGRFDDAYTLFKAQLQAAANPGEELARIQRALARTQEHADADNRIESLAQTY